MSNQVMTDRVFLAAIGLSGKAGDYALAIRLGFRVPAVKEVSLTGRGNRFRIGLLESHAAEQGRKWSRVGLSLEVRTWSFAAVKFSARKRQPCGVPGMSQPTLWSKMRSWVRPGGRGSLPGLLDVPPTETNRTTSTQSSEGQGSEGRGSGGQDSGVGETASSSAESTPAGPLSLWRRNHSTFEKLHEGQTKVIELIDSMQVHQRKQDARASEISSSLSQVASTLISIEGADRQQAEKLAEIADVLRQGQDRAARWEEKVAELPQLAQAQRDALDTVATQMEAAGAREGHMASSLDSFREAVTVLGDATTSSSVAVKSLQMSELESHERMVALLKEQNKRFTMLFLVTLVLVVIAIAAGLAALLKN